MSDRENRMVEKFWQQEFADKTQGRLILKYQLKENRGKANGKEVFAKREFDGIVLLDEPKNQKGESVNLTPSVSAANG